VVADQTGSPTEVGALARQVERLLREGATGLFHASCPGEATWSALAAAVLERGRIGARVEPMSRREYGTARRPAYSALDNRRLRDLGLEVLPPWEEALDRAWERIAAGARG
jgi:dTDP-4-dehydrorhamnose reductase